MDALSIVSAIASIVSLGLALGLNSEKLKKWLLPVTYIFIGISVGRVTSNLNEIVDNVKADPVLPGALFIIIACLFASCYVIKTIHNRDLCTKQPLCSRHTTKPKKNKEWQ